MPASLRQASEYPDLLDAVAEVFDGRACWPHEVRWGAEGYLPTAPDGVLMLMWENQGVCAWGVPLDRGDNPPVLVGGDLHDGQTLLEFSPSIGEFVFAFAWDAVAMRQEPLLQAQAAELDRETEDFLVARYRQSVMTRGWPCGRNLRFEGDSGIRILLWSCEGQCDWWVSATDPAVLRREAEVLMSLSDLRTSFWSNENGGVDLLRELRGEAL